MTFAQQLKEEYKQEFMGTFSEQLKQQGRHEGLEEGEHRKAVSVAKNMLAKRLDPEFIKEMTGLSDQELLTLEA